MKKAIITFGLLAVITGCETQSHVIDIDGSVSQGAKQLGEKRRARRAEKPQSSLPEWETEGWLPPRLKVLREVESGPNHLPAEMLSRRDINLLELREGQSAFIQDESVWVDVDGALHVSIDAPLYAGRSTAYCPWLVKRDNGLHLVLYGSRTFEPHELSGWRCDYRWQPIDSWRQATREELSHWTIP